MEQNGGPETLGEKATQLFMPVAFVILLIVVLNFYMGFLVGGTVVQTEGVDDSKTFSKVDGDAVRGNRVVTASLNPSIEVEKVVSLHSDGTIRDTYDVSDGETAAKVGCGLGTCTLKAIGPNGNVIDEIQITIRHDSKYERYYVKHI